MQTKILVVDADPQIRRALKAGFEQEDYKVLLASHGEEALDVAALSSPQVVVVDLIMRGVDGFEVCRQLREWSKVPIIVISTSDREADKIAVLDLGADDYLVKPFGIGEIQARVRSVLRRASYESNAENAIFQCDELRIDFSRRLVTVENREVHLTPKEYDLLRYMATNPDRVLTSRHLLSKFWGNELADDNHTLRVHVANLRRKVEKNPENPRFIMTEVRVGYRFKTGSTNARGDEELRMNSRSKMKFEDAQFLPN